MGPRQDGRLRRLLHIRDHCRDRRGRDSQDCASSSAHCPEAHSKNPHVVLIRHCHERLGNGRTRRQDLLQSVVQGGLHKISQDASDLASDLPARLLIHLAQIPPGHRF
jgi:hypothetical protein